MTVKLYEYSQMYLLHCSEDNTWLWGGISDDRYMQPETIPSVRKVTKEPVLLDDIDKLANRCYGILRHKDVTYTIPLGYYSERITTPYKETVTTLFRIVQVGYFLATVQYYDKTKFIEKPMSLDKLIFALKKWTPVTEADWIVHILEKS